MMKLSRVIPCMAILASLAMASAHAVPSSVTEVGDREAASVVGGQSMCARNYFVNGSGCGMASKSFACIPYEWCSTADMYMDNGPCYEELQGADCMACGNPCGFYQYAYQFCLIGPPCCGTY